MRGMRPQQMFRTLAGQFAMSPPISEAPTMRIAQRIAHAGAAPSRRVAETLIQEGRVFVNGKQITSAALDVGPTDKIAVDAIPLRPMNVRAMAVASKKGTAAAGLEEPPAIVLLHKLRRELVARHGTDPEGRRTVFDRLIAMGVIDAQNGTLKSQAGEEPSAPLGSLIPVGRLDYNSEGLLVLTNDRELAAYLMHPASGVPRIYRLRVYGFADRVEAAVAAWRRGATVEGMRYRPAKVIVLDSEEVKRKYGDEDEKGRGAPARPSASAARAASDGPAKDGEPGGTEGADSDSDADAHSPNGGSGGGGGGGSGTRMNTWLEVTLTEGKNRELRNVAGAFDLTVTRLIRVAYGPFSLRGLAPGDAVRMSPRSIPRGLVAKARAAALNPPTPEEGAAYVKSLRAQAREARASTGSFGDSMDGGFDFDRRGGKRKPAKRTSWESAVPQQGAGFGNYSDDVEPQDGKNTARSAPLR